MGGAGAIRVLLIEDDPSDADVVRDALASAQDGDFSVVWVERLVPGLDLLAEGGIDACLLDLSLPDSNGARTILAARAQAPDVPIVVLAAPGDEVDAAAAAAGGAQEYVVKSHIDAELLASSVRQAVEARGEPPPAAAATAIDPLTSLLSGRGLHSAGERQMRLATVSRRPFALLYVDVGLGRVDQAGGRDAGDRTLIDVANLLSGTFRNSDVVARMDRDEFCVILAEVAEEGTGVQRARDRLTRGVDAFNLRHDASRSLSLTVGSACFDPEEPCSFAELLGRAELAMLEQKRRVA